MSTDFLNDFRDDISTLLTGINYTVFIRETFTDGDVNLLRQKLESGTITTVNYAYITENESVADTTSPQRLGWYGLQQDLLISTLYEYDFVGLKDNANAKMQALQKVLFDNRQLGGKVDRMEIVGAQKGYTGAVLDPNSIVIGGLMIRLRIFYKTLKAI